MKTFKCNDLILLGAITCLFTGGNCNQQKDTESLMEGFKMKFDDAGTSTADNLHSNSTTISPSDQVLKWNGIVFKMNSDDNKINSPPVNLDPQQMDLQIQNLTRTAFSPSKPPERDCHGNIRKYYRDRTSIPIMFRKVIPPRGIPLPLLHFEFEQDNNTCRCMCKL